jgi:hypothetical protein
LGIFALVAAASIDFAGAAMHKITFEHRYQSFVSPGGTRGSNAPVLGFV